MGLNPRFGDADPEDAWDAIDPDGEKLLVLGRWIADLEHEFELEGATGRVRHRLDDLDGSAHSIALPRNSHLLERILALRARIEERRRHWDPGT